MMKNFITKSINNKIVVTIICLISIISFLNYWGIRGVLRDNLLLGHVNQLTNVIREIRMNLYDHFSEYEIKQMEGIEDKINNQLILESNKEFNNILSTLKRENKIRMIHDIKKTWDQYTKGVVQLYPQSKKLNKLNCVMEENKKFRPIFEETLKQLKEFSIPYVIHSETELTARIIKVLVLSLWVGLSLAVYFYTILNIQIVKRIDVLVDATRKMVQGDFTNQIPITKYDEISELTTSFNVLNNKIKDQIEIITENNINLEIKVKERTRELETILDNVSSAFLLINNSGMILPGFTASCNKLFGINLKHDTNICDYLQLNSRSTQTFLCMVDQVFDDLLPQSVSLDQIPKHYTINDKILELVPSAIRNSQNQVISILFTVNDITQLRHTERENDINRLLIKIIKNKFSFETFIKETKNLLDASYNSMPTLQRNLHTIKGNMGLYGLTDMAQIVDELEETILKNKTFDATQIKRIEKMLQSFLIEHYDIIQVEWDTKSLEKYVISQEELVNSEQLLSKVNSLEIMKKRITQTFLLFRSRPVKELLGPINEVVTRLASVERKKIIFKIINGHIKVIPELFTSIISNLMHLIRNAIVHGIERNRKNKSAKGEISLTFFEFAQGWQIKISDDGQGIDPLQIKKVAIEKNLYPKGKVEPLSEQDIINLIFLPGLTTMTKSTVIAGKGIGMDSVKMAIEQLNGNIKIATAVGSGTTFTINIPRPAYLVMD